MGTIQAAYDPTIKKIVVSIQAKVDAAELETMFNAHVCTEIANQLACKNIEELKQRIKKFHGED